jgi:hypothetical protein
LVPEQDFSPLQLFSPEHDFSPVVAFSPEQLFSPEQDFSPAVAFSPEQDFSPEQPLSPLQPFSPEQPFSPAVWPPLVVAHPEAMAKTAAPDMAPTIRLLATVPRNRVKRCASFSPMLISLLTNLLVV